jgi:hypothetical protein
MLGGIEVDLAKILGANADDLYYRWAAINRQPELSDEARRDQFLRLVRGQVLSKLSTWCAGAAEGNDPKSESGRVCAMLACIFRGAEKPPHFAKVSDQYFVRRAKEFSDWFDSTVLQYVKQGQLKAQQASPHPKD